MFMLDAMLFITYLVYIFTVSFYFWQVVYNANKLAKLVEKRKGLENWFIYYENKYNRNTNIRPTTKVLMLLTCTSCLICLTIIDSLVYKPIIFIHRQDFLVCWERVWMPLTTIRQR